MIDKHKIKRDYAYKCECGRLIKIDSENQDCSFLFSNRVEPNQLKLLVIECPDCPKPGTSCILKRDDIGKTLLPLYKGENLKFVGKMIEGERDNKKRPGPPMPEGPDPIHQPAALSAPENTASGLQGFFYARHSLVIPVGDSRTIDGLRNLLNVEKISTQFFIAPGPMRKSSKPCSSCYRPLMRHPPRVPSRKGSPTVSMYSRPSQSVLSAPL